VVLPASGWEMMAKVRRRRVSGAKDTAGAGWGKGRDFTGGSIIAGFSEERCSVPSTAGREARNDSLATTLTHAWPVR
jgi:hypothetical protein